MPASQTIHSTEEARARLKELHSDWKELRESERNDEYAARSAAILSEVHELDHIIELNDLFERRSHGSGLASTGDTSTRQQQRTAAEMMFADEQFRAYAESGLRGDFKITLDAGIDGTRAIAVNVSDFGSSGPGYGFPTSGYDTSNAGMLLPVGQPIAPTPRQARLYLRDLIPKQTTTLARLPYVRELNPTSNESPASGGATAVSEGAVKPTSAISLTGAEAAATVIATSMVISKQMWQDGPAVVGYLNQRMPYLVRYAEDWEFLNGTGTWPDVQGILNTSGIQTQSATAGDNAVTIGNAFAKLENSDGAATAVVLNPTDAWNMFTKRAAGGSGTFDAGTPFSALPLSVWGVPTYRTRAKAAGSALVADFQLASMIFDREQVNMQVYPDRYPEQNAVLLLVEERVALAHFRPDLYVVATLA
jgi:hypothetical protein